MLRMLVSIVKQGASLLRSERRPRTSGRRRAAAIAVPAATGQNDPTSLVHHWSSPVFEQRDGAAEEGRGQPACVSGERDEGGRGLPEVHPAQLVEEEHRDGVQHRDEELAEEHDGSELAEVADDDEAGRHEGEGKKGQPRRQGAVVLPFVLKDVDGVGRELPDTAKRESVVGPDRVVEVQEACRVVGRPDRVQGEAEDEQGGQEDHIPAVHGAHWAHFVFKAAHLTPLLSVGLATARLQRARQKGSFVNGENQEKERLGRELLDLYPPSQGDKDPCGYGLVYYEVVE